MTNQINVTNETLYELLDFRRELHKHPELSFEEVETTKKIKKKLADTKFEILDIDSDSGVIAQLKQKQATKTIGIRADIDALPIVEQTNLEFSSENNGVMHACGHDIHTTILMGFCEKISEEYNNLNVNLVVIFQPAEEVMGGAKLILEQLSKHDINLDEIICYHTWPFLEEKFIGYRSNKMMAGAMEFDIKILASGGHAAHPHTTADPIYLSANVINYFQSIVSRLNNPVDPLVITVGKINGGTKSNVISSEASFSGTIRSFSQETFKNVKKNIDSYISNLCEIHGAKYEIEFSNFCPAVLNDERIVIDFINSNKELCTQELSEPSMGSEDFAFYLDKIPGALFRIGTRSKNLRGSDLSLHNPKITFSEDSIITGILGLANYILAK